MGAVIDRTSLTATRRLSVVDAENAIHELADARGEFTVDLRELESIELGAGWRFGNAIGHLCRAAATTVELPDHLEIGGDAWHQEYTRSGLGLSLANPALRVLRRGQEMTSGIRAYYEAQGPEMKSSTAVIVLDLSARGELRNASVFAAAFETWAPTGLEWVRNAPRSVRIPLLGMVREAVANVYEHAYKGPCRRNAAQTDAYLAVRRYKTIPQSKRNPLKAYLEQLEEPVDTDRIGWCEVLVIDDGGGVAARQAQDSNIYGASLETEDEALTEALRTGSSIKVKTLDAPVEGDPGCGFTYIADGINQMTAFAELRTGRRVLTFDGSDRRGTFAFEDDDSLGVFQGTALQIVFPLYSNQLKLVA